MDIKVEYDGAYPNLCSGDLVVTIDGKRWEFPEYCMSSGGGVSFDDECRECVSDGDWAINEWPDCFPDEHKAAVLAAVNAEVPHGCCGGCV